MDVKLPQDRFTTVHGSRTRYWAEGDKGPSVLLIHGLGGFVESWMYNIWPLAEHYRVYALDLLGSGQTDKTPLVRDLYTLVDFIHGFIENQQIGKVSLIGNSMGGGLALQFTIKFPQKVEKLVLVDNAGMGRQVCSDFKFCTLPLVNNLLIRPSQGLAGRVKKMLVYDPAVITPEFEALTNKYGNNDGNARAFLATLTAGINILGQKGKLTRQLLSSLHTITAPTLVVWGKQDRVLPVSHAQIVVEKIPNARLEIFDNCGHMPMFEYPEKFNKLVLDFLNEKSATAPVQRKEAASTKT
jgi:pimeloyl-ACP methyl ester carboxylesterase